MPLMTNAIDASCAGVSICAEKDAATHCFSLMRRNTFLLIQRHSGPVWYNFPETPSGENEEPPILKRGVVESASFNYISRAIIYEVVYKDDSPSREDIIDEVSEDQLAYGANCPVVIEASDEGRPVSELGTVLFCEPSSMDIGKFIYTVMIFMEGSEARYEGGIDAERIKYRKVNMVNAKIATKAENAAAAEGVNVSKKQPSATNNSNGRHSAKVTASAPAVHNPDREAVPSSITCNSADKSKRKTGVLRKVVATDAHIININRAKCYPIVLQERKCGWI